MCYVIGKTGADHSLLSMLNKRIVLQLRGINTAVLNTALRHRVLKRSCKYNMKRLTAVCLIVTSAIIEESEQFFKRLRGRSTKCRPMTTTTSTTTTTAPIVRRRRREIIEAPFLSVTA